MNVVIIGPHAFSPKGTVRARAHPLGRALVQQGHQVTILIPPYDNPAESGRTWTQEGVRLENATLRRNDAWHQLSVPIRMARRAVELRPDVVHVFKPIAYSGMTGFYLNRFSRVPQIVDTDDWEGTGGWSDVNRNPRHRRAILDWQERWLPRHADAVTVASRTLQTQAWGFGVPPRRVLYLPNGPDPALRHKAEVGADETAAVRRELGVGDAPLALYLGHIPRGTDLDLALDALAYICQRQPETRLVIAGVGEGLPRLKSYADKAGVASRVSFPGWVDPERAHVYLAAADAIVNPYRDTLINRAKCAGKVVAAMAVGKAVVTSRVGENLSYIEHGRSGLLTEPGDAQDLAEALSSVLQDRSWAAELGRQARKRVWERFDWDLQVTAVERIYELAHRQGAD
ncbi:glycosyltransferase family 4 protein [Chloroflexota bacterium]